MPKTREADDSRQTAAQQLDALAQAIGKIGHDYNNNVHVITGSLELLRRHPPEGDSTATGLLDMMKRNVDQAVGLTQQLLTASDLAEKSASRGRVPVEEPSTTGTTSTGGLTGLRVLVVEDEALVRILIEDLLGQLACSVIGFAANGKWAIRRSGPNTPSGGPEINNGVSDGSIRF